MKLKYVFLRSKILYMKKIFSITVVSMLLASFFFSACEKKRVLPIFGEREYKNGDTIYQTIPDFAFVNQDSQTVTQNDYKDKIYVSDFFFTHCPTICPRVKKNMLRILAKYKDNPNVLLLSHTIDPKHDTVGRLKEYAQKLEISAPKWNLVTGEKAKIYDIAFYYASIAKESPDAPGGFDHSGYIILVDKNRRVRAAVDGTIDEAVTKFLEDIDVLLSETSK
jgi:protein SCO1